MKSLKRITNCSTHTVCRHFLTRRALLLTHHTVLVTGQLADDMQAVIQDIETLFGTLNEENLKLQ